MTSDNSRKIKLLKLWELLKSETDEEHPMDTVEIIERLGREGILVDRKILYSDIEVLNQYGFEVLKERGKRNRYYVMDRSFDIPEVRILMDAVQAAGFVTEKKTDELLHKVSLLAGSKQGEVLKENIARFSTVKSINESIYYSVSTIISAIRNNKKIKFCYFDYDLNRQKSYRRDKTDPERERWYTVNPVATVFDNDQYYLICYDDKHNTLANYRVDRMDRVCVLDEDITPNDEIERTDLAERKRQMFSMYSGEVRTVIFEADRGLIDVIFDKFGSRADISTTDNGRLSCKVEVQTGPMFIAWCCSFDNRLRVVSPPSVVESVKEHLTKTLEQYT